MIAHDDRSDDPRRACSCGRPASDGPHFHGILSDRYVRFALAMILLAILATTFLFAVSAAR